MFYLRSLFFQFITELSSSNGTKFLPLLLLIFFAQILISAQQPPEIPAGHAAGINTLIFSPDGKFLLSAGADRTIKFWDMSAGKLKFSVPAYKSSVVDADFSPDGKIFATLGEISQQSVSIWNSNDGRLLQVAIADSISSLTCLKFSPDGKYIAVGSLDGTIQFFSTQTWKPEFTIFDPSDTKNSEIENIDFSPDGRNLAVADKISIINWDLETKKIIWKLPAVKEHIVNLLTGKPGSDKSPWRYVAFSPDGKIIACGSKEEIRLVNASDGATLKSVDYFPENLEFSPDGKKLAVTGGLITKILFLDVETGKFEIGIETNTYSEAPVVFSPDGKLIAGRIDSKIIKVWDAESRKEKAAFGYMGKAEAAAWSPDDSKIAVANETITLFDSGTGEKLKTYDGNECAIQKLEFSSDGKYLAGISWSPFTGCTVEAKKKSTTLPKSSGLYIWDVKTGKLLYSLENDESLSLLSFSKDGKYLITGGMNNFVKIWQAQTGRLVKKLKVTDDENVHSAFFSTDGRQIKTVVQSGESEKLKIWSMTTGKLLREILLPGTSYEYSSFTEDFAFQPESPLAALPIQYETNLQIWNLEKGKAENILKSESYTEKVTFSPDGKFLAGAYDDWKIRIWDVKTGKLLETLSGHDYKINSLAFSADGKKLVSCSGDAVVKIWNLKDNSVEKIIFVGSSLR